ncbi:MAG: acetyl-CoA hydrolase [Proteobacteria bacterium]|nr:MAG: acetyl-CoA hydrolase [Pseudomonadota bacterium]
MDALMTISSLNEALTRILQHFSQKPGSVTDKRVRLATPLGLGKPNQLLNLLYNKVKSEQPFALDIYTALSLDIPEAKSDVEARFLNPFLDRHFGKDYPRLQYLIDIQNGELPAHINLYEFYVSAGAFKDNEYMQQHYRSMNYTHVASNLAREGIDIIVQLIARRGDQYSLSVNSDLTLDVLDELKARNYPVYLVGVVHPDLPFLGNDALIAAADFDLIVDSPEVNHPLFALPHEALTEVDTAIGLHASALVKDGGTLQIGIGSLSDSIVKSLILRHQKNAAYNALLKTFTPRLIDPQTDIFEKGLYGTSELVMDGFMHLRKQGILTRTIDDNGRPTYIHGAFALGSKEFYRWLNELKGDDLNGFCMTRVSKVNDLYDPDEMSLRKQRVDARFFNTAMQITLLGAAASETLPDGRVISGVGGQYNFVAMAHELSSAHSILLCRSASVRDGKRLSNIVWNHGNATIPRHLRDVVITEYGIAFVRGLSDAETISELLNITDSEFQEDLLQTAKDHLKISKDYRIPDFARQNTPDSLKAKFKQHPGFYEAFPFGSDFDEQELRLLKALKGLKDLNLAGKVGAAISGLKVDPDHYESDLSRLGLDGQQTGKDVVLKSVLLHQFEKFEKKV